MSSGSGGGTICFQWRNTGTCRYGASCKYLHVGQGNRGATGIGGERSGGANNFVTGIGGKSRGVSGSRGLCHQWQTTGTCRFGNACKYQHGNGSLPDSSGVTKKVIQVSDKDYAKFIRHLAFIKPEKIGGELRNSAGLWRRCWQNEDALDHKTRRSMVEVLAKVPGSSSIDPPHIHSIEDVVRKFLGQEAAQAATDDVVLTAVKTVLNAILRSLDFEWDCFQDEVKDSMSKIVLLAEEKLRKQNKDHRDVAGRLMEVLEDMEKPWRIKVVKQTQKVDEVAQNEYLEISYDNWQCATIQWLSNPNFFSPSRCPKMKSGKSSGVYESSDEYLECIHQLWVAMTFFDGHAALAPHCRFRGPTGSCGSALWPVSDTNSFSGKLRCRTKHCSNPVEYCCRVSSHDSLCGECASRAIDHHLGPPGLKSSTHIYDSKIKTIDPEGKMYLTEFKSRNPPPNTIHWRTTKRLSPPNLVGIVRLRTSGAPLQKSDRIIWAEIVFHHKSVDESRRREKGELAVDLSSIVDFDPDYFEEGSRVAIVDCMLFVPEWIPVLRAITQQKESKLPFDDGRHLNIWKGNPITTSTSVLDGKSIPEVAVSSPRKLIEGLVLESQLEPIKEIRRDPDLSNQLVAALDTLVTATTLDPMQLISFIDSLRNPVHLTQGPPGTGKSYLGVVLVRALIIIRDLWMQASRSKGLSPILVLSYKNHAIDEFLVDLITAEPSLSRNELIRIGGQCKDNRLINVSEKSAYHLDSEVKSSRMIADKLIYLKESVQSSLDRDISSFLSWHDLMFSGDEPQKQRKAGYDATGILMDCVVRLEKLEKLKSDLDDSQLSLTEIITSYRFLELDKNGKVSLEISREVNTPDGKNLVTNLVAEVRVQEHWGEMLWKWLCGKKPLPRCTFESCKNFGISPEISLCDDHVCSFNAAAEERCRRACIGEGFQFCKDHTCQAAECKRRRLPDGQIFCQIHACKRCVILNCIAQEANDPPPRNVCDDHPLCFNPQCLEFALDEALFCSKHNLLKCLATTKKGKPCKGIPNSRIIPFCRDHQHLAPTTIRTDESTEKVEELKQGREKTQCTAKKINGERCNAASLPGGLFCYDHSTKDALALSSSSPQAKFPKVDQMHEAIVRTDDGTLDKILETAKKNPEKSREASTRGADCERKDEESESDSNQANSSLGDLEVKSAKQDFDEIEMEEEGENLQHLREVFEVHDGDDSTDDESTQEAEDAKFDGCDQMSKTIALVEYNPCSWTWEMSLDERWTACQALMDELRRRLNEVLTVIRKAIASARKEHQLSIIRAKARVYENRSVIGGTMVGLISRLESVRKTRPFAVVVEEASEVLEPLLFSCLSESTVKLEMIGDHRQLFPSIMDRYEFELCNKVNISLFQRLIEAPETHPVPSTVLSIQRRMRKNICDLTRNFYDDVTKIQDHDSCGLQVVGQRKSSAARAMVQVSRTGGREIPGIAPHIFLWTHNGVQQRSNVGISRINTHEASMACNLMAYLVECGVPRSCIAVLTPYKGQLMLMRNMIFKEARFSQLRLLSKNPSETDVCRLSTVDRFQGDEEDIVICSLVVDENSRTGFVKLENRMIVLLSRARLGLYILGNTKYFESNGLPKHWEKTFNLLKSEVQNDNDGEAAELKDHFIGPRTGPEIPLCCPLHRSIIAQVSSSQGLKPGFCSCLCEEVLKCGHLCSLKCHWQKRNEHNKQCSMELESSCPRHPQKIECHKAFRSATGAPSGTDFSSIMNFYKCFIEVDITLHCGHILKLPCHQEVDISSGQSQQPECHKKSPKPYVFPSCGHNRDVNCSELRRFQNNPAMVKCEKDEIYEPSCGHAIKLKCWRRGEIVNGAQKHICTQTVRTSLPRCGHVHDVPCHSAQGLTAWNENKCDEVGIIKEGVLYGGKDYDCQYPAQIIRSCGHKLSLPCSEAFARASSLHNCQEKVMSKHPNCGHDCQIPCKALLDLIAQGAATPPEPIYEFREHHFPSRGTHVGMPQCKEKVKLTRKCGHVDTICCPDVYKPLSKCKVETSCTSKLCGHEIRVKCHLVGDLKRDIWEPSVFAEICETNRIRLESQQTGGWLTQPFSKLIQFYQGSNQQYPDLSGLDSASIDALKVCQKQTIIALKCGHENVVDCKKMLTIFGGGGLSLVCEQAVLVKLDCGHKCTIKCCDRTKLAAGDLSIKCDAKTSKTCWNYEKCRSTLEIECGLEGTVACNQPSTWRCPRNQHSFEINQCSRGLPLDCPGCSVDDFAATVRQPPKFDGQNQFRQLFANIQKKRKKWINRSDSLDTYRSAEKQLLKQYGLFLSSKDLWSHSLSSLNRIPCFRILVDKKMLSLESFDPRRLVKQGKSFHGIMAKRLSSSNIRKLASTTKESKDIHLLLGFASVVKTKVLSSNSIPKSGIEKTSLYMKLSQDGFDSLSFMESDGLETIVVWDPFPMIAICNLVLSGKELVDLAVELESLQIESLEPKSIRFSDPPEGHIVIDNVLSGKDLVKVKHVYDDDEDDDESTVEDQDPEVTLRLEGTVFEGMVIDLEWPGGISSDGKIPPGLENDIMEKMQFLNPSATPFAAKSIIKSLLEKSNAEILHLLMAAEMLQHSTDDARASLEEYLRLVKGCSPGMKIHPWSLVVAARVEKNQKVQLLSLFLHLFPSQEKYLTEEESAALKGLCEIQTKVVEDPHKKLWKSWCDLKEKYPGGAASDATEELLKLTGLRKVKEEVLSLWKSALQLKRMDAEARKKNLMAANYCFLGNPGTGKTTVARLFAKILCDSEIREKDLFVEITAQKAKDGGTDEFNKTVQSAMGGVLFIDEAYDLDPVGDFKGKPIVNELLTLCENDRDKISVILAGYEDDFQKKFFAYNEGLKSRFREVLFEDFDEQELGTIWKNMRSEKKWEEEEGVASVVVKRMSRASGRKGFGNAREVRRRLESATKSAMSRLGEDFSMETMVLEIVDVIGEDPRLSSEKLTRLLSELEEKVGWKRVKERVRELIEICGKNYQRELLGKPPFDVFLNRMFLGNPGTGKTTCAKLYGKFLKELGFLSIGDVVSKTASDFVGQVVGESQNKTCQILDGAKGKVLIIDEAYALNDSMYGKQVLDTLVEKVQGGPSDDIAVLLLGYEAAMVKMIGESNPGLARRFPKEHAFYFDDYDENELLSILNFNISKQQIKSTVAFREKALEALRIQKAQANFGNAGSVELVLKGAMLKASKMTQSSEIILDDCHIDDPGTARAEKDADPLWLLDKLYRMEGVKARLDQMRKFWAVEKQDGNEKPELGHFVFLGAPGTGKTTVARAIADILFSLTLKPSNKIVEKSALDLTADYVGQTTTKVNEALKEAKGGVLFIDEAYNLGQGPFGKEACDTLVAAMTSEEFKDVLIVIAGYPKEINEMLNSNAGLKSRFTNFFEFPEWEPEDCVSYFKMCASKEGFQLKQDVEQTLHEGCGRIKQLKGWGNGRDVKKLWTESKSYRAERVYDNPVVEKEILVEDITRSIKSMIQARIGKLSDIDPFADPLAALDDLFRMEGIKKKLEKLKKLWAVERREGNGVPNLGHFVFTGSPGTGKTTVARAIARILFGLQLKPSDKIVETTAQDMTGQYVGQTKTIVHKFLEEAKGGCLFIDEAYSFEGQFGREAVDTIVAAMTSPEYSDVQIIIAGYPVEIDEMFRTNSGLKSRFTHFFEFPDWTPQDCVAFFKKCVGKEKFQELDDDTLSALQTGCKELIPLDGWANGRDVKRILDEAKSNRADRVCDNPEEVKMLCLSDVQIAVESVILPRRPKSQKRTVEELSNQKRSMDDLLPQPMRSLPPPQQLAPTPPLPPMCAPKTIMKSKEPKPKEAEAFREEAKEILQSLETEDVNDFKIVHQAEDVETESDHNDHDDERDEGVPDEVWEELQASKKKYEESLRELERIKEEEERAHREEEEARRRHEAELERIQKELEKEEQERAQRELEEKEARRRHEEELRRKKLEEERRRRDEEKRIIEETRKRLQTIRPCPMGYNWHKTSGGWRCGGGSHFVSDEELRRNFAGSV